MLITKFSTVYLSEDCESMFIFLMSIYIAGAMVNFRKNLPKISPKPLSHFMLLPAVYKELWLLSYRDYCSTFLKKILLIQVNDVVCFVLIHICLLLKMASIFPMLIGHSYRCDWQFHMFYLSVVLVFILLICSSSLGGK